MRPLYIFDLDGTLALNGHRQHLVAEGKWDEFFLASKNDLPNKPIIEVSKSLWSTGSDIYIWSGRGAIAQEITTQWLAHHGVRYLYLLMRPIGNTVPDDQLKAGWLESLSPRDRNRLVCVFDDRQKVVDMWRSKGVVCCQVAPGEF